MRTLAAIFFSAFPSFRWTGAGRKGEQLPCQSLAGRQYMQGERFHRPRLTLSAQLHRRSNSTGQLVVLGSLRVEA
jgi:hypothetical protein